MKSNFIILVSLVIFINQNHARLHSNYDDYGYMNNQTKSLKDESRVKSHNYKSYENNDLIENLIQNKYCVSCNLNNLNLENKSLNHVDISHASAVSINLKNGSLNEAKAAQVDFENANLENIDARKTDFESSDFENAVAIKSNFSESNFYDADLKGINAYKAKFKKTNLAKADFTNANLKEANFKNAIIFDTEFEGSDRTDAIWTRGQKCMDKDCTKMTGGDFSETITSLADEEDSKMQIEPKKRGQIITY